MHVSTVPYDVIPEETLLRGLSVRGGVGGGGVFSDSSGIRAKIGDSSGIRNGDVRNDFSDEKSSLRAIEANFPL